MTGRLWRFCEGCGYGGGHGKRRDRRHTCRNSRCDRYGMMLALGSLARADSIRARFREKQRQASYGLFPER